MNIERAFLIALSVFCLSSSGLALPSIANAADGPSAPSAFHEEWSNRLIYQKAMIDKWRVRLEKASAAYARAVAEGKDPERVDRLAGREKTAAAELRAAQEALPRLVEEAREDGVSEDVLGPYRFVVAPADAP